MASKSHPQRSTASAVKQLLFTGDTAKSVLSDSERSRRLSVADISSCLARLHQQSDEAKLRIVREIEGRQEELRHLMFHACQAGDDVAVLLGEVDGLLRSSSRGCKGGLGYVNDVSQMAGELRDLGSRAAEKAEACAALQEVQRWQQAIVAVEQMVSEGRHLEASPTVANLKSTLDAIKDAARQAWGYMEPYGEAGSTVESKQLRVIQLIEERLESISKELIKGLEQQLWACLLVDPHTHTITVRPSIGVSQSGNDRSAESASAESRGVREAHSAEFQPSQVTEVALWSVTSALESLLPSPRALWSKLASAILTDIVLPLLASKDARLEERTTHTPPALAAAAAATAGSPGVSISSSEGVGSMEGPTESATAAAPHPAAVLSLTGASVPDEQQRSFPPLSSSSSPGVHDCTSLEHVFRQLLVLVRFLKRHVAMGDDVRLMRISLVLWPRLAEAVVDKCLSQAVPRDTQELAAFQKVVDATRVFEASLQAEGFLEVSYIQEAGSDARKVRGDLLLAYAADVDIHFAARKRAAALAAARAVLLDASDTSASLVASISSTTPPPASPSPPSAIEQAVAEASLPTTTTSSSSSSASSSATGGKSVFDWEPRHVSSKVQRLAAIVHRAMKEASQATERTAGQFYAAARDALSLYRALSSLPSTAVSASLSLPSPPTSSSVPARAAPGASISPTSSPSSSSPLGALAMEDVPQLAMLACNDANFLAHLCLSLGFQYKALLPGKIRQIVTFVDFAPLFRELADERIHRQYVLHEAQIKQALDTAGGFANTDNEEGYRTAVRALKQVTYHLARLAALWWPVSSPSTLLPLLAQLASYALLRCSSAVLAIRDMSVEETIALRRLFSPFTSRLPAIFRPTTQRPAATTTSSSSDVTPDVATAAEVSALEAQLLPFRKLTRLTDLLDMSLMTIAQSWESCDLQACGFTNAEVYRLVRAVFSDTPVRRQFLQRIQIAGL